MMTSTVKKIVVRSAMALCLVLMVALNVWPRTTPYRIRMTSSVSTARLVGVGYNTTGDTIVGSYNYTLQMHEFDVEKTGYYVLQEDIAGGSAFTMRTDWSDTTLGKRIDGIIEAEYGVRFSHDYENLQACVYNNSGSAQPGVVMITKAETLDVIDGSNIETCSNLHIIGGPMITTIKSADSTIGVPLFEIDGDTNVVISGILHDRSHDPTEVDIDYFSSGDHFVTITNAKNIIISNCSINNTSGDGFYLTANSKNVTISNNIIRTPTYDPGIGVPGQDGRNGIALTDGNIEHIIINGNIFIDGFPAGIDIESNKNNDSYVSDIVISNNVFQKSDRDTIIGVNAGGVFCTIGENAGYTDTLINLSVSNNVFRDLDGPAFYFYESDPNNVIHTSNALFTGNVIENCGIDTTHNLPYSVFVRNAKDVTINNNVIKKSNYGINIERVSNNITVSGNRIEESNYNAIVVREGAYKSRSDTTSLVASADSTYFYRGNLYTGDGSGHYKIVYNLSSRNIVLNDNTFKNNGLYADTTYHDIIVQHCKNVRVTGNTSTTKDSLRNKYNYRIRNADSVYFDDTNVGYHKYLRALVVKGCYNLFPKGIKMSPMFWSDTLIAGVSQTLKMGGSDVISSYTNIGVRRLLGIAVRSSAVVTNDTLTVIPLINGIGMSGTSVTLAPGDSTMNYNYNLDPGPYLVDNDVLGMYLRSDSTLTPDSTLLIGAHFIYW